MTGLYLKIRRWVDRDLSRGARVVHRAESAEIVGDGRPGLSTIVAVVPFVIVAAINGFPKGALPTTEVVPALALGIGWFLFLSWRSWRLLLAKSLKDGRYYERRGRSFLPAEYRDSEDGLLASRRRQRH